jgi:hypothetical protein
MDHLFRIGVVDPNDGERLDRFHQSLIDRILPDGGADVAALCRVIDKGLVDPDRTEVVHVPARLIAGGDDRQLAGKRISPAESVDLADVPGLPKMARMIRSLSAESCGRSFPHKKKEWDTSPE